MAQLSTTEISCGIRQLHGLSRDLDHFSSTDHPNPKEVLLEAFYDLAGFGYPVRVSQIHFSFVIFSDSLRRGNGKRLARYITSQHLGQIFESPVVVNANTDRKIQMWTWKLDREALVRWFAKEGER